MSAGRWFLYMDVPIPFVNKVVCIDFGWRTDDFTGSRYGISSLGWRRKR